MRSLDRVFCALERGTPDVVPCMPVLDTYHTPKLLGLKLREAYLDGEKMAKSQLKAYLYYHVDGVEIGLGPGDEPENMLGCKVIYPEDDVPIYSDPPVKNPSDIDKISPPHVSSKQLFPLRMLSRKIGNDAFLLGVVSAPFEYVCILHGFAETLRDLRSRPRFVLSMLKKATGISEVIGEALLSCGALGLKIKDSPAASTIISPIQYRKFAQPYERKVIKSLKRKGSKVILHICTDSNPILKDMSNTGADALEIDYLVDLKYAKQLVGLEVCLKGNLAPVHLILREKPQDISKATRSAILKAGFGGYIVSTGDSIPRDAPFRNVSAIVRATKRFGTSG